MLQLAEKRYSGKYPSYCENVRPRKFWCWGRALSCGLSKRKGSCNPAWIGISQSSVPPHAYCWYSPQYPHLQSCSMTLLEMLNITPHAENLAASRTGDNLIIIVVDLRADDATLSSTLHYWVSFVQHQRFKKLSFIIVGSHSDLISNDCLVEKGRFLHNFPISGKVRHFMLDCRKPRSTSGFQRQISALARLSPLCKLSIGACKLTFGLI